MFGWFGLSSCNELAWWWQVQELSSSTQHQSRPMRRILEFLLPVTHMATLRSGGPRVVEQLAAGTVALTNKGQYIYQRVSNPAQNGSRSLARPLACAVIGACCSPLLSVCTRGRRRISPNGGGRQARCSLMVRPSFRPSAHCSLLTAVCWCRPSCCKTNFRRVEQRRLQRSQVIPGAFGFELSEHLREDPPVLAQPARCRTSKRCEHVTRGNQPHHPAFYFTIQLLISLF